MAFKNGWELWEANRESLSRYFVERNCPVCGAITCHPYFETQCGYSYVCCDQCKMVYIRSLIPMEQWEHIYCTNQDYKDYMDSWTVSPIREAQCNPENVKRFRYYFSKLQSLRSDHSLVGLKYLDIGTFDGDALVVAQRDYGMESYGIEGRESVAKIISETRNLFVKGVSSDRLEKDVFGGSFDIVTAFESLEHSFNPSDSIRRIFSILEPGGLLMISVPNADCLEFRYLKQFGSHASGGWIGPGHINMFNSESLWRILEDAKFTIKEIFTQYSSSLDNIYAVSIGAIEAVPCHATMLEGGVQDSILSQDRDVLNALRPIIQAWEEETKTGPILIVIAQKPGSEKPALLRKNLHDTTFSNELIDWLDDCAQITRGELLYKSVPKNKNGYLAILKKRHLKAGTTIELKGTVWGGISFGVLKDGEWVCQESTIDNGPFWLDVTIHEDGEYVPIISHHFDISTRRLIGYPPFINDVSIDSISFK